jgi:hypothetical protein
MSYLKKLFASHSTELQVKATTDTQNSPFYQDLHLEIKSGGRSNNTKIYDKRDAFNTQAATAYVVHISQLVCYSKACAQYSTWLFWAKLSCLRKSYVAPRLE